ncbi:MAG: RNA polymerase sigma factor [Gemmatales bacterium]|nr:MAG: RNA polymerase sigma factor [Gemmatales bacterium]
MEESDLLLRRCQRGDESALDALVHLHQDGVYRLAWRVLRDAVAAEEAVADVFVKIWSKCEQWQGQASAATWIYRVAYRTILDTHRSRSRRQKRFLPLPPSCEASNSKAETSSLHDAIAQLPVADQALVHLFYFERNSLAEIEAILGVGREALKMRLARARQKLRAILEANHE